LARSAFFDGTTGRTGRLPVPLVLGGGANLRWHARSTISRERFPPSERTVVDGIPVATVQRAVFDEMRRVGTLLHAVQTIEMTAAARLISVALMTAYVTPGRNGFTGVPLARRALALAIDDSRSAEGDLAASDLAVPRAAGAPVQPARVRPRGPPPRLPGPFRPGGRSRR
jgi:hypothetical protein